jgi:uncharacterized protein (TIGR01732 family)
MKHLGGEFPMCGWCGCGGYGYGYGGGYSGFSPFVLIVVLFILLIIVGASFGGGFF